MMSSQRYTLSKKAFICTDNIYVLFLNCYETNENSSLKINNLFPFALCMLCICILYAVYLMISFSSWSNFIFTEEKNPKF